MGGIMATVFKSAARERSAHRIERYNADMRLWMRILMWATRNCDR
jgi:hypothetical protein